MLRRASICALFLASATTGLFGSEAPYRPIALDKHPSGELYILDASGRIFSRSGDAMRQFALIPFGSRPVDILSARLNGQEYVFVCSIAYGGQMQQQQQQANAVGSYGHGQIIQFDASGHWKRKWDLSVECGGLDIDPTLHVIYFANARAPEFLSLRIDEAEGQTQTEGFVKGARVLGPLVIDPSKHIIYTADPISGTVFSYELDTHVSRVLSGDFGEPQALAMNQEGTELYVADGTKHTVWKLGLGLGLGLSAQDKAPVAFSSQFLSHPTGVALGANGHLWVADAELHQIIDLAPNSTPTKGFKAKKKSSAPKSANRKKTVSSH